MVNVPQRSGSVLRPQMLCPRIRTSGAEVIFAGTLALILFGFSHSPLIDADETVPSDKLKIYSEEPATQWLYNSHEGQPLFPNIPFLESTSPVDDVSLPVHTRYGVVAKDLPTGFPKAWLMPRVGMLGVLGSHTQGLDTEFGFLTTYRFDAGSSFDGTLTADISETVGIFGLQWSYGFAGLQSKSSAEFVYTFAHEIPICTCPRIGIGWRADWYFNRSFEEVRGGLISPEDEHHHLDQRLGTYILHFDHDLPGGFKRFRIEFENDASFTGGDDGDEFRTAFIRLLWLRQLGAWQRRYAVNLDLFTGATDPNKLTDDRKSYDTRGLPFSDRSQGLLGLELGLSYFHQTGGHLGEIGFDIEVGPDTEEIRDVIQNRFVHKHVTGSPFVPKVNRPSRFKTDLSVYYIVHF